MSIRALSQPEEKLKWRQDENDNDGESAPATAKSSSPASVAAMLSRGSVRHSQSPKIPPSISPGGVLNANVGAKGKGPVCNYYVVLEKSPPRMSADESDSSTYDNSVHCCETDICQDSTDYDSSSGGDDSFTTEGIATVDIVEYEVASASDGDADSVDNSSSGTDDHGLVMATMTALDTTSSNSEFADSEESDSDKRVDRELTEADYWQCIRCKNPHNSPLYRMCEKCYKIRRTHFPPRPRFRRKKRNRHGKSSASPSPVEASELRNDSSSISTSQEVDEVSKRLCDDRIGNGSFRANYKNVCNSFKKRKLNYSSNKSQLNSAAEASDEELSDIEHRSKNFNGAGHRKRKAPMSRSRRETMSTNLSSSGQSIVNISNRLETSSTRKRKLSLNDTEVSNAKQLRPSECKILSNVENVETASDTDNETISLLMNNTNTQKDSGISSAHSSQEPPSSSLSDERSLEKDDYIEKCGKVDIYDEATLGELKSNTAEGKSSNSLISASPFSQMDHMNLIRSVSDCSGTILNNNLSAETFEMNMSSLDSNLSSYGSCIICLSGPKNGVFVHSRFLHLCSCYKCAVKIWSKYKRCPVCNSSVKNVLKLFVH